MQQDGLLACRKHRPRKNKSQLFAATALPFLFKPLTGLVRGLNVCQDGAFDAMRRRRRSSTHRLPAQCEGGLCLPDQGTARTSCREPGNMIDDDRGARSLGRGTEQRAESETGRVHSGGGGACCTAACRIPPMRCAALPLQLRGCCGRSSLPASCGRDMGEIDELGNWSVDDAVQG